MTERYQDYVIKGGQFVGKFEEMYQKFDDPWEQKAAAVSYVRHSTLFTLEYLQAKKVLEIGCGLGYFSHYIHEHLPYLQLTGMDISSTAVQKAKAKFPELSFVEGDIMRKIPPCPRGGASVTTRCYFRKSCGTSWKASMPCSPIFGKAAQNI